MLQREEDNYPFEEMTDTGMTELLMSLENISLEDQLANIGVSFHDKLFELIDEAHLDNKDVWKRANLDRKHFSKIQCDQNYHPKKKTVMALCIALHLDLEQSKDLLARADWAFSPSSKVDLIVQKAIIDKQYDMIQLNVTLFKYTNEILGVQEQDVYGSMMHTAFCDKRHSQEVFDNMKKDLQEFIDKDTTAEEKDIFYEEFTSKY